MEWISVKDRLPEFNTPVLVYVPSADVEFKIQVTGYDGDNLRFGVLNEEDDGGKLFKDNIYFSQGIITHWQPLPEPPKE